MLALIVLLILSYFAYTKELPWSSPGYTATATFSDASTLRETAPVRIAGVNVGKVTNVEADGDDAKVTFTVDPEGLPLHDDARITIRPRLFLEGNFFLDLRPGSPSAPDLPDGGVDPGHADGDRGPARPGPDDPAAARPQEPRRLPRRLRIGARRRADARRWTSAWTPRSRASPAPRRSTRASTTAAEAGKSSSQVSQALLGEQAGDLRGLIKASGSVFQQLASRDSELSDLITNFSITTGALAAESQSLQDTLAQLAPTVEQAQRDLPVDQLRPSRRSAPSPAS